MRYARVAGFMFLFVIAAYLAAMFVVGRFQVSGNFAETARRIAASEALYRVGLSLNLVASICTVLLAMGLYVVLKPIDANLALLALLFRLVEAAISAAQGIVGFVMLRLYIGTATSTAFDAAQLSALASLRSAASAAEYNISAVFFGMGSILFFHLFSRSSYLP